MISARIDAKTYETLQQLKQQSGWNFSKVIRFAIQSFAINKNQRTKRKIIGMGRFASRAPDLGSNKKHMKGFGQ
jgi:hypothetical protein